MKKLICCLFFAFAVLACGTAGAATVYKIGDTVAWHHTSTTQWGTAYYPHSCVISEEGIQSGAIKLLTATCTQAGTIRVSSREWESPNTPTGSARWHTDYLEVQVEALGHCVKSYTNGTDATCQMNTALSGVCERCGETVTKEIADTKREHTYSEYSVHTVATCVTPAQLIAFCDFGCGETDIIADELGTLDAGNHEAVSVLPEVKPTATQTGLTEGSMCTACNGIIVEQQVIPALRVDHLPDTGDASSVTLWASMLFVGLAGAIAMRKRIDA